MKAYLERIKIISYTIIERLKRIVILTKGIGIYTPLLLKTTFHLFIDMTILFTIILAPLFLFLIGFVTLWNIACHNIIFTW